MLSIRIAAASIIAFAIVALFTTSAFAQSPTPSPSVPPLGPPGFSVIPVDGPEDIPVLQAQIANYLEKVRAFVASILQNLPNR